MTVEALLTKLAEAHISHRAYRVLREIECSPESMAHLAIVAETSAQNMTGIVRRLLAKELVKRWEDGKHFMVGITAKGLQTLEGVGE